jgi:hypothetical protein
MHEGRVFTVACLLLLFELNAAPLAIVRGDVLPDAVTLKLKNTSMRGQASLILPAGGQSNYRYMLRAADHQKPLVVGTSVSIPTRRTRLKVSPAMERFLMS